MTRPQLQPHHQTHYGCIRLNDLDLDLIDEIYDLPVPGVNQYDELPDDYLDGVTATIDDVTFEIFILGGAYHLAVTNSKFIDYVRPCSPCVPNAGDLTSPDPQGIRTYSIPPTWFYVEPPSPLE
jgi:hypothetical protein